MKAKKDLQRFTKFEIKKRTLLDLQVITKKDLEIFNKAERIRFFEDVAIILDSLKGNKRDEFLKQIEQLLGQETKNQIWEYNHSNISIAISSLIDELGRMPSKVDIASRTGLSRVTIDKHLKEYSNNPIYIQEIEQFKFMTSKVLAKVFSFAMEGNISACRLYLETLGVSEIKNEKPKINNQNNFIQINGLTINQQQIMQLKPEQLIQIENIVNCISKNK